PVCGYEIMQSSVPEVMVMTGDEVNFLSGQVELEKYTSYGIGPGIGQHPRTLLLLKAVLIAAKGSLVIDADGINLMAKDKSLLKYVPENSVLTPHPGEFDRLVGKSESGYERMVKQLKFSKEHKVVVVLKGKHTSISIPDGHCYFNSTGNPGMATAGSGDVLTGLITGLLAQGYQPLDASIIAVYIHGLAGDIVAGEVGEQGMIAGDIIENIGNAFRIIER
ncbi:MAG TPA: NAD(P)H-hydrate dehydratase, partial [Flavobacteriales bacterium]|nr:NAD(P)H-hydrate dehydratase [Flavobacteriales bacterium]